MFVGGGTPSLVDPPALGGLLRELELLEGAEVTVEANPEDVTDRWAAAMVAAGVTRVSLGVQSFDPVVLASLGRHHDPSAVRGAIRALSRGGIARVSVDLIYGAVGETADSWRRSLESVLGLDPVPGHVSAYALTVEPGTPLAGDTGRHPDDDVQADRYETASEVLAGAGYGWYEISNWARPGEECRHNWNYWRGGDYRGIGCAAHSHRAGRRWWNLRTPERYLAALGEGRSATAVVEELSPPERELEALELRLRTREGVPAAAFGEALGGLVEAGLVSVGGAGGVGGAGDRAVLTLRGRLLANEVSMSLRQMQRNSPTRITLPLSSPT